MTLRVIQMISTVHLHPLRPLCPNKSNQYKSTIAGTREQAKDSMPPLTPSPRDLPLSMANTRKSHPRFRRTSPRKITRKKAAAIATREDGDGARAAVPPQLPFFPESAAVLPQSFFEVDSLELAPRLLGKFLRRDEVVLQITEVEAYRPNDSACHGRFGITSRTAPVFGPGGHAYVYLCYGLHMMLNIVADKKGMGAAVLIRSCAPVSGLEIIQERRGQKTEKPILLTGPGKVGQALGISTALSNHPLYKPDLLQQVVWKY
ncbi:DNA-3-methyladenine glycosylase isoform X2 [Typha latifolia]|uniref:DNA-3-methyladenine glycosylase isoform X2 n=1 Tax=Typha latifolia TaxID=4733 RepID=UPI003C2E2D7A